jgi:hypothetical protein
MTGRFGVAGGLGMGVALVLGGVALAFSMGRFPVGLMDVAAALWSRLTGQPSGLSPAAEAVIFNIRGAARPGRAAVRRGAGGGGCGLPGPVPQPFGLA